MDPAPLVLGGDPPTRLENELVKAAVPAIGAAARTRANAVFYGFFCIGFGFIVTMVALVCVDFFLLLLLKFGSLKDFLCYSFPSRWRLCSCRDASVGRKKEKKM